MITYAGLTDRIKRAKKARDKAEAKSQPFLKKFWIGYIQACRDMRNNVNIK